MNGEQAWQYLVQLRRVLSKRFNVDELRTLCFDLQVDYEDLPGDGKSAKVRELLAHLARRNRINDLLDVGREARPDIDWPQLSVPATEDEKTENLLAQLHQKRAHALSELYGQIVDVEGQLRAWAYRDMPVGLPAEVDPSGVMDEVRELSKLASKALIYLDDETRKVVDTAVNELVSSAQELERREVLPEGDESWSAHVSALDRLFDTIPPAVEALECQIRRILSSG